MKYRWLGALCFMKSIDETKILTYSFLTISIAVLITSFVFVIPFLISVYFSHSSPSQVIIRIDNSQSVVNILCDKGTNEIGGSGTIVTKDGLVLTNNHIVVGASFCLVSLPSIATGAPVEIYKAQPFRATDLSSKYDINMLKIYGENVYATGTTQKVHRAVFPAFTRPDGCASSSPHLNDSVRIYGYPVTSGASNLTVTGGIISSFTEDGLILTDAKIDSGNSGGLAVDQNGCLLGIPSAIVMGNYQNLGVIIPLSKIQEFFKQALRTSSSSININKK